MALTKISGSVIKDSVSLSGNVSVGGTLTYEDVTNIDAIGIVTARSGIKVLAGGIIAVGVTTATTFSGSGASLTNLPAAQLSGIAAAINGSNITNLNASNIASGTVPTARLGSGTANSSTFLAGDSTFKTVSGVTINGNVDNRLVTATGTTGTLEGESTLTYDNGGLNIAGNSSRDGLKITNTGDHLGEICVTANRSSANSALMVLRGEWNNTEVASIYISAGTDTTNKDDGQINFYTSPDSGTGIQNRMGIDQNGNVTKPSQPTFHAYGGNSWTNFTGSNNVLKLLNTECNIGSHYKTSGSDDGKFVCPVAGTYFFYLTIYSGRTDNSQTDNSDYLSINFVSSTAGSLANKGGHHIAHYYNEADRDSTRTMSYIKTCAAGEKIYIQLNCNGTGFQVYGGHSSFGGYLIG
tara:strand:- start:647 stop:1876 length:1230 start_codon:yes stop_codon:yes gene_type:complete